jgi:nitroreductase
MVPMLSPDEVLTTTRSVRKRLDLSRPVPRSLIAECMDIAFQAPNGRNLSSWQWVVIDDPKVMAEVGRIYNGALSDFTASAQGHAYRDAAAERAGAGSAAGEAERKMSESVDHLREIMGKLPAAVVPLFPGRPDKMSLFRQASSWGSVLPAVWNLFLALRVRGLGSVWTTAHLMREQEMADLLGIPSTDYTQVGLFPIAYTIGTEFKKAPRKPVEEVVSWNRFGAR